MGLVWMGLLVACVTGTLTENIALRRSCSQSSTLNYRPDNYGAGLAVDGRATTNATSTPLTCANTRNETDPTWTVNLNTSRPEKIQHIRLYLRDDLQIRNNGMEILVASQMCYNWSSTEHPPPIASVTCRQPLTGNTVTIRIHGPRKFLTLCEVQIFVCSDGWFSEDCAKQCRCLSSTDVCDKITGHCSSGCFPGYYGTDCQTACADGSFGSNCTSQCGHCLDGEICYKTNGTCPKGCEAGWQGNASCHQACPDGSYGINCTSQCGNCLDGESCDKKTGTCPGGCAAGWINDDTCLQQCAVGMYGINCTSHCGLCQDSTACDKYTGEGSKWGIPVAATLAVMLIFTMIGATIYIRRLMNQLESLKTKMSEEHYLKLEEKTRVQATESTYEHIDNATPYYNTVDHVRDEI